MPSDVDVGAMAWQAFVLPRPQQHLHLSCVFYSVSIPRTQKHLPHHPSATASAAFRSSKRWHVSLAEDAGDASESSCVAARTAGSLCGDSSCVGSSGVRAPSASLRNQAHWILPAHCLHQARKNSSGKMPILRARYVHHDTNVCIWKTAREASCGST